MHRRLRFQALGNFDLASRFSVRLNLQFRVSPVARKSPATGDVASEAFSAPFNVGVDLISEAQTTNFGSLPFWPQLTAQKKRNKL
jgi:hypothetical protein